MDLLPAPLSIPMWATALGRALLLAIGTCSILLATKFPSGCSAEKASIPLGQTATGCSATCGDICRILDSPVGEPVHPLVQSPEARSGPPAFFLLQPV